MAGCGGGLEAEGKVTGIYIGTGDCEYSEEMIVVKDSDQVTLRTFQFADECAWDRTAVVPTRRGKVGSATYYRGFSCPPRRKSPLSGAAYRVSFDWKRKDGCGQVPRVTYVCARGCSTKVPSVFKDLPVDCDY